MSLPSNTPIRLCQINRKTLDLFYGALIDLLPNDPTPELIRCAESESLYPEEEVIFIISFYLGSEVSF